MKQLAIVVSIALSSPAVAQNLVTGETLDGNRLLEMCSSNDLYLENGCAGYIAGSYYGQIYTLKIFKEGVGMSNVRIPCAPAYINPKQLQDIVLRYLRNNPQERHYYAAHNVISAMNEAFPCN